MSMTPRSLARCAVLAASVALFPCVVWGATCPGNALEIARTVEHGELCGLIDACKSQATGGAVPLLEIALSRLERASSKDDEASIFLGLYADKWFDLAPGTLTPEHMRRFGRVAARLGADTTLHVMAGRHVFAADKYDRVGDLAATARHSELALAAYDGAGSAFSDRSIAFAARQLAIVELLRGNTTAAARAWERIAVLCEQISGRPHPAVTLAWSEVALLQAIDGDSNAAEASLRRAYSSERVSPVPRLDDIHLDRDAYDLGLIAEQRLSEQLDELSHDTMKHRLLIAQTLDSLAAFSLARGQLDAAERSFDLAQKVRRDNAPLQLQRAQWLAGLVRHLQAELSLMREFQDHNPATKGWR